MTAETSLEALIADARAVASSSYTGLTSLIEQAQVAAAGYTHVHQVAAPSKDVYESLEDIPVPDPSTISFTRPDNPPESVRDRLQNIEVPTIPEIGSPPSIDTSGLFEHALPTQFAVDAPGAPSLDTEPSIPEAPALTPVGAYSPRALPNIEQAAISIPTIDIADPEMPETPDPQEVRAAFDASYAAMVPQMRSFVDSEVDGFLDRMYPNHKARLEALEARLDEMLAGTSGFSEEVEQAIYTRARSRIHDENAGAEKAVYESTRKRGFTLPQGFLFEELHRSMQAQADRNAKAATDLAISLAEQRVQLLQTAVQVSASLRTAVRDGAIQYANTLLQVNRDALDYAKQAAASLVQVYDLARQQVQLEDSVVKTKAVVYELRIKAGLADLERMTAEVKMAELTNRQNELDIENLSRQAAYEELKIKRYAELLKSVSSELQIRDQKLSLFGRQLDAYMTQAKVKEIEYNIYRAAMAGDSEKLQGELAKLEAYTAEANARLKQSEVAISGVRATSEYNRNLADIYKTELQEYLGELTIEKTTTETDLQVYLAGLDTWSKRVQKQLEEAQLELQYNIENNNNMRTTIQTNAQLAIADAKLFMEHLKLRTDAATTGATAYGAIASAINGAQNTLVELAAETITSA